MKEKKKNQVQCVVFDKDKFYDKRIVKTFCVSNGFVIDNRLRNPIMNCGKTYRVRQKNPSLFNKKTFKELKFCNGVIVVVGEYKQK